MERRLYYLRFHFHNDIASKTLSRSKMPATWGKFSQSMPDNKLLDEMLLSLADAYESQKNRIVTVEPRSPEEWETLRDFLPRQAAGGLIAYIGTGKPSWAVALTTKGYTTYSPRITAKRALGSVR
jgi:hypothetical protein